MQWKRAYLFVDLAIDLAGDAGGEAGGWARAAERLLLELSEESLLVVEAAVLREGMAKIFNWKQKKETSLPPS
jgi:hypothetical protein